MTTKTGISAPAERDPRIDPVAGDRLINRKRGRSRTVLETFQGGLYGGYLDYGAVDLSSGHTFPKRICRLTDFRKWAATAEIIKRGDGGGK